MWLTRQKGYGRKGNQYELWAQRPIWAGCDWDGIGPILRFCNIEFESVINVRLKPGEIREVEKITFEFKD